MYCFNFKIKKKIIFPVVISLLTVFEIVIRQASFKKEGFKFYGLVLSNGAI